MAGAGRAPAAVVAWIGSLGTDPGGLAELQRRTRLDRGTLERLAEPPEVRAIAESRIGENEPGLRVYRLSRTEEALSHDGR